MAKSLLDDDFVNKEALIIWLLSQEVKNSHIIFVETLKWVVDNGRMLFSAPVPAEITGSLAMFLQPKTFPLTYLTTEDSTYVLTIYLPDLWNLYMAVKLGYGKDTRGDWPMKIDLPGVPTLVNMLLEDWLDHHLIKLFVIVTYPITFPEVALIEHHYITLTVNNQMLD